MSIRKITDQFHVTGQLTPEQMADMARLGYKTVICMRPDHEGGPVQPIFAEIADAAAGCGLSAHHLPVVPGRMTPSQVAELRALLDSRPGPVLAFCASGQRCAMAFDLATRG